jgi:hypothetical protein
MALGKSQFYCLAANATVGSDNKDIRHDQLNLKMLRKIITVKINS